MEAQQVVTPGELRRAAGQFATGVTIITSVDGSGSPVGCTVSSFCSLSLDPPLVLVCIGKDRAVHPVLTSGPGFVVNILSATQERIARLFANPTGERFGQLQTQPGLHGIPMIPECLAYVHCDLENDIEAGDHSIVVGRARRIDMGGGQPLLYSQGAFIELPDQDWERSLAMANHEWLLSSPW